MSPCRDSCIDNFAICEAKTLVILCRRCCNLQITNMSTLITPQEYTLLIQVLLYYDSMCVSMVYEDQPLARNVVQPIFPSNKNVTMMHVRFTAQTAVLYQSVPTDLKIEKSSGDIELDVLIVK
jgi:hypothetical protein